jgi:hypothetical protein
MMMNESKMNLEALTIGTLPVGCLTTAAFRIPKYQRGYRWKKDDVEKLLNDLKSFLESTQDRRPFYCLQPLVVTKSEDHPSEWEVVDGQQRLTTLFLIWNVLHNQEPYELSYDTRDLSKNFLKAPEAMQDGKKQPNIDFHHIYHAHQKIQEWFTHRLNNGMHGKFRDLLADTNPFGRNVRFIWYRLQEGDDAVAAFTRLNVGKIPLTDEELIRALFLRSREAGKLAEAAFQHRMALEWDRIESALQEPGFWGFVYKQTAPEGGRVRLLFELCAPPPPKEKGKERHLFTHYEEKLIGASAETPTDVWKEIVACFEQLEEWHRDPELFHLVGYVTTILNTGSTTTLRDLLDTAKKLTKKDFANHLRTLIHKDLIEKSESKSVKGFLSEINFDTKVKTRQTLALFNIATLIRTKGAQVRFPFHLYHDPKVGWDIEHVHSQGGQNLSRVSDQKDWLRDTVLGEIQLEDKENKLESEITAFLTDQADAPAFENLYKKVGQFFGEDGHSNKVHGIGNLTLLDQSTNRGYGNAPFVRKRAEIIEVGQNGTFILPCTRDLFLKVFSKKPGNLRQWDIDQDGASHEAAICETLETFFDYEGGTPQ